MKKLCFPFLIMFVLVWESFSHRDYKEILLVAGNFSLNGEIVNLAQYDIALEKWRKKGNSELFVYDGSNGEIWDVSVNNTHQYHPEMYIVGVFDTITKTSQIQYCSISQYDGSKFSKVGEGLCPRGSESISSMILKTTAIGDDGDIFVGGSFETRVWGGHEFLNVSHVAQFKYSTSSWLPLKGGKLQYSIDESKAGVYSLVWDKDDEVLYIGGRFDNLNGHSISSGLAVWTKLEGLKSFQTAGVGKLENPYPHIWVESVAFERKTKSLFISGYFQTINGIECPGIAAWNKVFNSWRCLYEKDHYISTVTYMLLSNSKIYLAGWASDSSTWGGRDWHSPYAIAVLDIHEYIRDYDVRKYEIDPKAPTKQSSKVEKSIKFLSSHPTNDTPKELNKTVDDWKLKWSWYSNFSGTNGPIYKLAKGVGKYKKCLFVGGAFDNYPSLVVSCEYYYGEKLFNNVTSLGKNQNIHGLITSINQLTIPVKSPSSGKHPKLPRSNSKTNFGSIVLLGIIGIGIMLGLGFAIGYFAKSSSMHPSDLDLESNKSSTGFSLVTLADGHNAQKMDLKECFERAMKARHLPIFESLLMINPEEINVLQIIGEGSFGRVWSGYWRNSNVAVKEFVFAQAAISGGSLQRNKIIEEIVGEAGIMAYLRHPKILQLYGCSLTMQAIWLVSELCPRGSLKMVLSDKSVEIPLYKKLSICIDIADGMHYLHTRSPPIIHRDLKSQNIFITEQSPGYFVAKIGDWGSARAIALTGAKSMTQGVGTACWLSPEVINNAHFSKFSDVYAYGIILWEIFTRQDVYEGLSAPQIIAKVAHENLRPNIPWDCPWNSLMIRCWNQDPLKRPMFFDILKELSKLSSSQMIQEKGPLDHIDGYQLMSRYNDESNFDSRNKNLDDPEENQMNSFSYLQGDGYSESDLLLAKNNQKGSRNLNRGLDFHPSLENIRIPTEGKNSANSKFVPKAFNSIDQNTLMNVLKDGDYGPLDQTYDNESKN